MNLIPTLLFIAALALLPAWLVGGAALGAAAGIYWSVLHRRAKARKAVPPLRNVVRLRSVK